MEYGYTDDIAQIGQIVDSSNRVVDSFAAEGVIEYGVAVKRGTDKASQVLTWAGDVNTPMLGVSVFTQNTTGNYVVDSMVSVMTSGRVFVNVEAGITVVAGERAYVDVTSGAFTNVATANLLVGKFLTSAVATADNLFALELSPARI